MKPFSVTKYVVLLLLVLSACQPQIPPTAILPTVPPTSTPDSGIISPENVERLAQIKQLGMGEAFGAPIYSPDGKWLYQATTTGVFVFDTVSYANIGLLAENSASPYEDVNIALSPDGKILASGNHLINTEDGTKLPALETPPEFNEWPGARSVKFSSDGSLIARSYNIHQTGAAFRIGVWNLSSAKLINTFDVSSLTFSFDFSRDGHYLITKSGYDEKTTISLYEVQTGKEIRSWPGQRGVFLSENLLAIEAEAVIRIYDLSAGNVPHAFFGKFPAFSPDGQFIVLWNFGQFKIYRISDEQLIVTLDGNIEDIDDALLKFSPDGRTLVGNATTYYCCGGQGSNLFIWDTTNGVLFKKNDGSTAGNLFAISPDGNQVAITTRLGTTQIFNLKDGALLTNVGAYSSWATGVAFLPSGNQLVVAAAGGTSEHFTYFRHFYQSPLFFYEVDSGTLYQSQPANEIDPHFAFSTDGKVYVPEELNDLLGTAGNGNIGSVAFSNDGTKFAVGYPNGLFIWDLSQRELLLNLSVCPGQTTGLAFSPDGQQVARACIVGIMDDEYPNIQVLEAISNGKVLMNLDPGFGVSMVAYSPDGQYIAAGGKEGVVIWKSSNGRVLFKVYEKFVGYQPIGALGGQRFAFSPDGRILAIGLADSTLGLWDIAKSKKIFFQKLTDSPYNPIYDLDFSPDGQLLAVGFQDGGVRIFGIK